MTAADRLVLSWAARLMEYPDADFFANIPQIKAEITAEFAETGGLDKVFLEYLERLESQGEIRAQEKYVSVFDHDPAASLYMSWHRYGNDRGQGKAMAALNGLYRSAGFEPDGSSMPDYLPRMLEFMSASEEWAVEVILDGFGPELGALLKHVSELDCDQAEMLNASCAPLGKYWPGRFAPRTGPDPTVRPMARPEPEEELFARRWKQREQDTGA